MQLSFQQNAPETVPPDHMAARTHSLSPRREHVALPGGGIQSALCVPVLIASLRWVRDLCVGVFRYSCLGYVGKIGCLTRSDARRTFRMAGRDARVYGPAFSGDKYGASRVASCRPGGYEKRTINVGVDGVGWFSSSDKRRRSASGEKQGEKASSDDACPAAPPPPRHAPPGPQALQM